MNGFVKIKSFSGILSSCSLFLFQLWRMGNYNDQVIDRYLEALNMIEEKGKELNERNIISALEAVLRKSSGDTRKLLEIESARSLTKKAYRLGKCFLRKNSNYTLKKL